MEVGNGEDLEPLLGNWTGSAWWQPDEINDIKFNVSISIDKSRGFQPGSGQQLAVFVDGRLTFEDSSPKDANSYRHPCYTWHIPNN
ncbi:MAG: hypothetical protein QY332_17510 [Anaerolineales bacterium]|nr:MAG: hypothetical protein QY332_17510 [Anaerolineales bacterium]